MSDRRLRWMFASGTAVTMSVVQVGLAGELFHRPLPVRTEFFHRRTCVRPGLPPSVAYGHDTPRMRAAVLTKDVVEEQVLLVIKSDTFVEVSQPPLPWQASGTPSVDSILNRPGFSPVIGVASATNHTDTVVQSVPTNNGDGSVAVNRWSTTTTNSKTMQRLALPGQRLGATTSDSVQPTIVRRKSFAPTQPSIVSEEVTLDRIGLAIYETGHVAFTGLISHSGGIDGLVRGSDVVLKVRGYGRNRLGAAVPPDGPLHFEMRRNCRVSKGDSETISLVPVECCETIRARYDEITHLEVILETSRSR